MAFEDIEQLKQRSLNKNIFQLSSEDDIMDLMVNAGFSDETNLVSRRKGKLTFHCVVAKKKALLLSITNRALKK